MTKKILLGTSNFYKLISNGYLYVDKSLFIKEIIDSSSEVLLFSRARRWGKSSNLSLLRCFLAPTFNSHPTSTLFKNLLIEKADNGKYINEHQGKYVVIDISFKDIKDNSLEKILEKIRAIIQQLYNEFYEELNDSKKISAPNKKLIEKFCFGEVTQAEIEQSIKL